MKFPKTKSQFWLPVFALSATVAAPQLTLPAQAGLFGLSEQDEIQAGREVAIQAEKEYGAPLPPNHPMSVRVRTIGQQFANLSARKNIPYTYKVLANDKVLNAFAAPGGPIYVTTKLVTTTANDAELAYVLGHETGHIDRKHIVESVEKQQKAGILVGVLGAILGKGKKGNIVGTLGGVAFNVWQSGYGRDQEKESDVVGVRWMSQLGYDPKAAISMLAKLDDGRGGGFLDKYLATHPQPKDRQTIVASLIQKENLTSVAQRMGGPKLWMAGNNGGASWNNSVYNPTSNPASNPTYNPNTPNYYPNPGTADSSHNPVYDPRPNYNGGTVNGGTVYPGETVYPGANQPSNNPEGDLDFGAPLVYADRNNTRVYLAPVLEAARWAGATARANGNVTVIQRGNSKLELRENSTTAYINDRPVTLSVAAQRHNGTLYAPLGTLMQGMGGQATYDANSRTISVLVGNRSGSIRLQ
ncbi:MAG TPA: M48 family metalloprotease [Abditibacteriaceae bacterium]